MSSLTEKRADPPRHVAYLGGNGHAAARLLTARPYLEPEVILEDVPYPGFEGRPEAADWEAFLDALVPCVETERISGLYATGIGGLIALAMRARGHGVGKPLVLQGAVLWGLRTRRFPQLMRAIPGAAALLRHAFGLPVLQRRFARKHFRRELSVAELDAFFGGYSRCTAFASFFRWMTPALLEHLEAELPARTGALEDIVVWECGHEGIVSSSEVQVTEEALGVSWPREHHQAWGHYPMIDDPQGWAMEVRRAFL